MNPSRPLFDRDESVNCEARTLKDYTDGRMEGPRIALSIPREMNGPLWCSSTYTAAGRYPKTSGSGLLIYVNNLPLQATQWAA